MARLHTNIPAPKAKKEPVTIEQLGFSRTDNYAWLKDKHWQRVMANPSELRADIKDHLKAENAYMAKVMAPTKKLQDALLDEFKGRIKDDDSSVPAPDGPFAYAHKFRPGDEHGLYIRTPRHTPQKDETILLDADALAQTYKQDGFAFFDIGAIAHSDDHKFLAYALDLQGSEQYQIFIKDIERARLIGPQIQASAGDLVWAADNQTLFWVERDENNRPCKVYRQNILSEGSAELVYDEDDPGFFVSIGRSDTGNWIEILCNDHTTSETWLVPAKSPKTAPKCARTRQRNIEYSLHDHGEDFYILTNKDNAIDFKIMKCTQTEVQNDTWETLVPHSPGTLILDVETYQGYLVRLERKNALPRIVIHNLETGEEHSIDFNEEAYALGLEGGYEFDTPWLRFSYSSPTTPHQIYDYHMQSRERTLLKTTEVPSGHNPKDYTTRRLSITARDGETIPVTVVHKAGLRLDGKAPCLLYGYGSYGITIPASFRTSILSLIDRGFVYAIAHIRGSMAKGYQWYLDGKLDKKINTFNDFVDTAKGLSQLGYTRAGQIIAHGGSAGGLLVGAALNQAPDIFAGVIAAVPFVDVLNTMSDETLPLTPPEWPEWGNPLIDAKAYKNIASYCPYQNVTSQIYPPVLITAGLTDPRVTYWEPAKWAAKLRELQQGEAPVLLKTHMDAGHQGESGRYASLKDLALEYAFAIETVKGTGHAGSLGD